MSILERYANFYAKKLGANNVKIARFHWSRKSRDSCPTSSAPGSCKQEFRFPTIPCALRHFPIVNERVIDARRSRRRLDIPDTFQL